MMEIRYEGYGPAGVALIVDCLTDNKNRTVSEVRHAFTKMGGNLGTAGSVAYLFKPAGVISTDNTTEEDTLMELVMDAGGDDVIQTDTGFDVLTAPTAFIDVKSTLEQANVPIDHAEVTMLSEEEVSLDEETAEKLLKLIDRLEDLDDVQTVYSNATLHDHAINS
jgi:YebC/PmpR family DNA-binding regulatory protein